jgi:hypothetical protein
MMRTKNAYCGDGWEFEITTEDKSISLSLKKEPTSVKRWELEELVDFLKKYLENH